MKIIFIVVSFILLAGSLFMTQKALALPAMVEQQVTLVKYQHEGKFDYKAYLKPSYYYDGYQSPQPMPQIPTKFVDGIDMSFTFKSTEQTTREAEVNVILENGSSWQKKLVLVPAASQAGDFTLSFPIDFSFLSTLAQAIDAEIGALSSSAYDISIEVTVSGPQSFAGQIDTDFTQSLSIKLGRSFTEIGSELTNRQGNTVGTFDYTVNLKPNTLFDEAVLKPPAPVISSTTIGPGDTLFLRLVDNMDMSFSYQFKSDKPARQRAVTAEIYATIEIPNKWSKTMTLVPAFQESGDFTVIFPLDLKQITQIANTIQQETGISSAPYNLVISANVSTTAETDYGTIKDGLTYTIGTTLSEAVLNWGELRQSKPGSITKTETVENEQRFLWLPPASAKTFFPIAAGLFGVLFIGAIVMYFLSRAGRTTSIDHRAQQAARKYKDLIVEVNDLPDVKQGEAVVRLDSLDDLAKAAEGLFKPVLHKAEGQKHTYCVLDTAIRYEYHRG